MHCSEQESHLSSKSIVFARVCSSVPPRAWMQNNQLSVCLAFRSLALQNAARALPTNEWHVADTAPGMADIGSGRPRCARTTANAEFCIPTSMLAVRACWSVNPRYRIPMYPKAKLAARCEDAKGRAATWTSNSSSRRLLNRWHVFSCEAAALHLKRTGQ